MKLERKIFMNVACLTHKTNVQRTEYKPYQQSFCSLPMMEPALVWKYFEKISGIYRESGHNKEISDYLKQELESNGFKVRQELADFGKCNIVATRNVNKSKKDAIILQAHMDMVGISDDGNSRKQIKFKINNGWLSANKRTLGADDGIGVASALAVSADKQFSHLPLEIIFTVDEETTSSGAYALKAKDFLGKKLINLDNEELSSINTGCAGLVNFKEEQLVKQEKLPEDSYKKLTITINGGKGGHSGVDIDKNRMNAISSGMRIVSENKQLRIISINGGKAFNAIPDSIKIELAVMEQHIEQTRKSIAGNLLKLKQSFSQSDPDIKVNMEIDDFLKPSFAIKKDFQDNLLDFFTKKTQNGVKSRYKDGEIKTSYNPAVLNLKDGKLSLEYSARSSEKSELGESSNIISKELSTLLEREIKPAFMDSPWQPAEISLLSNLAVEAYKSVGINDPKTRVIHGFLETAAIAEKVPALDQISIGPTIENPHSIDEKVEISSVQSFFEALKRILEKLSNQ